MEYRKISEKNREIVNKVIIDHWYTTQMIVRGNSYDMTEMDGYIACEDGVIRGLITYKIRDQICEIMSLTVLMKKRVLGLN